MKVIRWKTEESGWISQDIECKRNKRNHRSNSFSISLKENILGINLLKRNDFVYTRPRDAVMDAVGYNLFTWNTITQSRWSVLFHRTKGKSVIRNQAQLIIVFPILTKRRDILIHFIPASIRTAEVMLHRMAVIQKLLLNKVARQMLLVARLVTTLATLGNHDLTPRIR